MNSTNSDFTLWRSTQKNYNIPHKKSTSFVCVVCDMLLMHELPQGDKQRFLN